jgi:hypothetical protein
MDFLSLPKLVDHELIDMIHFIENKLTKNERVRIAKYLCTLVKKDKISVQYIDKDNVPIRFDIQDLSIDNIDKLKKYVLNIKNMRQ